MPMFLLQWKWNCPKNTVMDSSACISSLLCSAPSNGVTGYMKTATLQGPGLMLRNTYFIFFPDCLLLAIAIIIS